MTFHGGPFATHDGTESDVFEGKVVDDVGVEREHLSLRRRARTLIRDHRHGLAVGILWFYTAAVVIGGFAIWAHFWGIRNVALFTAACLALAAFVCSLIWSIEVVISHHRVYKGR